MQNRENSKTPGNGGEKTAEPNRDKRKENAVISPPKGTRRRPVWAVNNQAPTNPPKPRRAPGAFLKKLSLSLVGAVIAAAVTLYVNKPELEPLTPSIECAICDDANQIHPPENSQDNGAIIRLPILNTGKRATTVLDHNLSATVLDPSSPLKPAFFSGQPDANDGISVDVGQQMRLTLSNKVNEATIFSIRHGAPEGSSWGPIVREKMYLYGHVRYRGPFYLPTTTNFCFEYFPPSKGLGEYWGVCSEAITELVHSAHR